MTAWARAAIRQWMESDRLDRAFIAGLAVALAAIPALWLAYFTRMLTRTEMGRLGYAVAMPFVVLLIWRTLSLKPDDPAMRWSGRRYHRTVVRLVVAGGVVATMAVSWWWPVAVVVAVLSAGIAVLWLVRPEMLVNDQGRVVLETRGRRARRRDSLGAAPGDLDE